MLVWLADCNKGHTLFPSLSAHPFVMWLCSCSFQGRDSIFLCFSDFWLGDMTDFSQWTLANVTQLETWKSFLLWHLFSYCSWNLLPPCEQVGVSLVFGIFHSYKLHCLRQSLTSHCYHLPSSVRSRFLIPTLKYAYLYYLTLISP